MDKKAVREIKSFVQKLKKDFEVEKILFFGSRTGEDYLKYSDVDLVIVSEDFESIDFTKRMSLMYLYWDSEYDVDFLCYTPIEFERLSKRITIVREALRKGIEID